MEKMKIGRKYDFERFFNNKDCDRVMSTNYNPTLLDDFM